MAQSPTVASWQLARHLKQRREERGLSVQALAKELGVTRNYWSLVENERTVPTHERLSQAIELLEFDNGDVGVLAAARSTAAQQGWWDKRAVLDSLPDLRRYYGFEAGADVMRTYTSDIVNGLLQTEEYARALIGNDPSVSPMHVQDLVDIRLQRQERLWSEDSPLRLTALMSEAVLHQRPAGEALLARQLQHMLDISEKCQETITIRMVPFTSLHGMLGSSIQNLLDFDDPSFPTFLYRENVLPFPVTSEPQLVKQMTTSYEQAINTSLTEDQTQVRLLERIRELGKV